MLINRVFAGMISVSIMVLSAGGVFGQTYPERPIRIVCGLPGGSSDDKARIISQGISGPLGTPVIVENRPSILLREIISKALPDGYTLLIAGGSYWLEPLMRNDPLDPLREVVPISMLASAPNILVVHPSFGAKSVQELVALAKAKPGVLNYGSAAPGSSTHLAGELFKSLAGVNIIRIAYKSTAQAITGLIGGEVQLVFSSASGATGLLNSGKLRALAVTSSEPSALAPGLPTMAASGVPGYESVSSDAIFAPAKTPATIVNRLNQEVVRVLNRPEVKQKMLGLGSEVVGNSPAQSAAMIKSEIARIGKVIKDAGIKVD